MPSFSTQRRVPFSAQQMFDLVADVESYPEFVPLCEALKVRSRSDGGGGEQLVADMTCGYKAIRERFTSRVTLHRERSEIVVAYVDGPFRHLDNIWRFRDDVERGSGHCIVEFSIDYSFKSKMLSLLVGGLFDKAFRRFAAAFEARAHEVYGRSDIGGLEAAPQLG